MESSPSSQKLIAFITVLSLFSVGCKEGSDSRSGGDDRKIGSKGKEAVILTGQLERAQDSIEHIYFRPFHRYKHFALHLDSAGRFEEKIALSRPLYLTILRHKIFVRPGDSLHIEGDLEKGAKSLSFSGDAAEENEYLVEKAEVETRQYQRSPEAFIKAIDSVEQLYEELLDSHELSREFVRMEKERMKWEKAFLRLRYERIHPHFTKKDPDSLDLPKDFYTPLTDLESDPGLDLSIPMFYNFIRLYADHLADKKRERDSTARDAPELSLQKKVIEERFGNDSITAALLAKNLFTKLQRDGIDHTKPLLEELEKSSLYPDLTDSLNARYEKWKPIQKGKEAPGFAYPNIEGDTVSLEALEGNYVYIDAWATWCGPCKREIPHLKELENAFKDADVSFVSISLDHAEVKGRWKEMVKKKDMGGHQLFANGEAFDSKLARDYLINSIPRFILIGPKGKIIDNNAERPSGEAEEQLKEALGRES